MSEHLDREAIYQLVIKHQGENWYLDRYAQEMNWMKEYDKHQPDENRAQKHLFALQKEGRIAHHTFIGFTSPDYMAGWKKGINAAIEHLTNRYKNIDRY